LKGTHEQSFQSRDKPSFEEVTTDIDSTFERPERKREGNLDGDLYHCICDSNLADDVQNNTENKGTPQAHTKFGKAISNQHQHSASVSAFLTFVHFFHQVIKKIKLRPPFGKGSFTQISLSTLLSHMLTVTQDALVKECAIYYTTALTLLPFLELRIVFSARIVSLRFCGILCGTFT